MATVAEIAGWLEAIAPARTAESWDRVGLQTGDPGRPVARCLVALTPSREVVAQAVAHGAQLLITHHPLIFAPPGELRDDAPERAALLAAVRGSLAVLVAHTNLDLAEPGVNVWLAARLGLLETSPLVPGAKTPHYKLVVFVPEAHAPAVQAAVFAAGAGGIGRYDHCGFKAPGEGSFRPLPGSRPFLGREGETERVAEVRFETVVPEAAIEPVLAAMHAAHPYEEVAYDLYRLERPSRPVGLGRIGRLAAPKPWPDWLAQLKAALACPYVRVAGTPPDLVQRIAVCGGAGGSTIAQARARGAELLVTGDVKFHDAQDAADAGFCVVDAGHFATERPLVAALIDVLAGLAGEAGARIEWLAADERDPFVVE
ncbi:MAG TPA: Nif3-like dinuclear metal center hexameric protein [Limnochordia bacterium]|nr:Nif3-like dinuclear metal center hexameric protein [Limnochordia bacterium]